MTDEGLTIRYEGWLPPEPEPEPPRPPARWDGLAIPGRCTHVEDGAQCDNQARSSMGWWDGGGPGLGTWHYKAWCPIH
ncbi:hypothetical protein [Mycolicibacterium fluoranthenivorans]|nr:hypothetical protein [Mycolicibacterium fluoranthenivorans]